MISLALIAGLLLGIADAFRGTALASFTIDDEKKLGREFYEKLDKANALSRNEQANAFLSQLGNRILSQSNNVLFDFRFSIVQSSAVNAFATPGGYVYVNQGLISLVENEAQLAGVLAHEIAHVNGRHIAEIIDRSTVLNLSTLAAIIAGAFLGGSGDAMAAVTSFSLATASTLTLKYSREHEEAADRIGMAYLVAAGYDGSAMLDFLKIMKRYEYYSNSIPSYFLTHPGTDERTRYIDGLLQTTYTDKGAQSRLGGLRRVQTLLLLDAKGSDADHLRHFQQLLKTSPDDVDALYGLAVTQDRLGMLGESIQTFEKALLLAPEDADLLRDLGIVYFKSGRYADAFAFLNRVQPLDPDNVNTLLYLGKTAEAQGDPAKALEYFKKLEGKRPDDPEAFYHLAMAYGKTSQPGDSHYYFGRYFKKRDKSESALFHFRAALKHYPPESERALAIVKEMESLQRGSGKEAPVSERPPRGRFFSAPWPGR